MKVPAATLLGLVFVTVASAQSNNSKKADDQWDDVVKLTIPATNNGQAKKTAAQADADKASAAATARQAAQAAKAFYTNNPTHVSAGEAKKLEAAESLLGVTDSDPAYEATAKQVAAAYRSSSSGAAVGDRFEVAVLAEHVSARAKLGPTGKNSAEMEKIADKLRAEFGSIPEVFNYYIAVARGADMSTALGLANKVLQWPASADASAEAQSIVARNGLLGKPLAIQLTRIDGQVVDLSHATGQVTLLVCLSAPSGGYAGIAQVKKSLPSDCQVIYYYASGTVADVTAAKAKAPVPGVFCYESAAGTSTTLQQLGVHHLPYIFGLNRTGRLAAFGPVDELAAVLAAAAK